MSYYSLFYNPIPPTAGTAQKWRIGTKTSNLYDSVLTAEMVIQYYDLPSFDITGKRMTIFHMGSISSSSGIAIVLSKGTNSGDPIQVGLLISGGTSWNAIPASFCTLNNIGNISTDAFYLMLTYDYSGSNTNVNFYVTTFNNSTNKTAPDFPFSTTVATNIEPIGNQWGFGASPEPITDPTGYISTEGYNCYVAQNLETSFLRTWDTVLPSSSNSPSTYAMFNTVDQTYSLYHLNKTHDNVPASTSNLQFQLYLAGITIPGDMLNNAASPPLPVNVETNVSAYPTLEDFAINALTNYTFIQPSTIACLLEGTNILTNEGYKLIENISLDDTIITGDDRKVKVTEIHKTLFFSNNENVPRIIKKGEYNAIDDLYISNGHGILINNEYFDYPFRLNIQKSDLLNKVLTYYHLVTEDYLYDTLVANGVVVETYGKFMHIDPEYLNGDNLRIFKTKNN